MRSEKIAAREKEWIQGGREEPAGCHDRGEGEGLLAIKKGTTED